MSATYSQKRRLPVHIQWMIMRDIPEVLQIEAQSFEFAWTRKDFLRSLRPRNTIGLVAHHGDDQKVVGFMIYQLYKSKLNILNFAVHPQYRNKEVGTQMIERLISKLTSHRRTSIMLTVRETNLAAQLFFQKQDFHATRVLRNFYEDSGEDAFLMEYRFGDYWAEELETIVDHIGDYDHR